VIHNSSSSHLSSSSLIIISHHHLTHNKPPQTFTIKTIYYTISSYSIQSTLDRYTPSHLYTTERIELDLPFTPLTLSPLTQHNPLTHTITLPPHNHKQSPILYTLNQADTFFQVDTFSLVGSIGIYTLKAYR
jgi:hypothetical protein